MEYFLDREGQEIRLEEERILAENVNGEIRKWRNALEGEKLALFMAISIQNYNAQNLLPELIIFLNNTGLALPLYVKLCDLLYLPDNGQRTGENYTLVTNCILFMIESGLVRGETAVEGKTALQISLESKNHGAVLVFLNPRYSELENERNFKLVEEKYYHYLPILVERVSDPDFIVTTRTGAKVSAFFYLLEKTNLEGWVEKNKEKNRVPLSWQIGLDSYFYKQNMKELQSKRGPNVETGVETKIKNYRPEMVQTYTRGGLAPKWVYLLHSLYVLTTRCSREQFEEDYLGRTVSQWAELIGNDYLIWMAREREDSFESE